MLTFKAVQLILEIQEFFAMDGYVGSISSVGALERVIVSMMAQLVDGTAVNPVIYNENLFQLWDEYMKQRKNFTPQPPSGNGGKKPVLKLVA